jgi:hypothetical protein
MSRLNDEQIEYIKNQIENSKIKSRELRDDLLDHFCCVIEDDLKKGIGFAEAFKSAFNTICPNGLDEIQQETIFLLTYKKILIMKKLLFLSGFLTTVGFSTGIFFKTMHWPGATIIILASAVLLVFFLLPLIFLNSYKKEISKLLSVKLKYIFGYLGIALFLLFVIFRINHWEGGSMLFLLSMIILNFGFFPFLFYRMYKKSIE